MPRRRPRAQPPRRLLGPTCGPELASIGIETVADLQELGWQEACARWADAYPLRLNVNAFCGVVAAIEGVDWRELDPSWKQRIRAFKAELARSTAGTAAATIEPARSSRPSMPRVARRSRFGE